ncbi:MAG: fibronectin type III domain-containing protein [Bacteroidales bacterium]|jgi:hypothetical protein|nr:fibronectin type III domain-containing protein [Bacteroidales bacterium]
MKKVSVLVSALLLGFGLAANAQNADFTNPSWTQYQRTVKAGATNPCVLVQKEMPYNVNTAINGNPATQCGVTWYCNAGVVGTKLQIVQGNSGDFSGAREITATATELNDVMYVTSGNNNNDLIEKTGLQKGEKRSYISNKVLIDDLTPNTTYSYRVGGANDVWSDTYTFTTAKNSKDAFSFIYVTDTQSNTDEMFEVSRKTLAAAQENVVDAKFLLITGDLVETSGANNSEWEWEQWFETMKASWQTLPIVSVQGNHDTSPNANWFNHFHTNTSFNAAQTEAAAKTAMDGTVYSFVYGDALFMILNWEDYGKGEPYFAAVEAWMQAQIAANSDVKWRIAAFHKNMFTGSKSHQSDADGKRVRERMAPVFQELGIDLALEGHDHVYEVMGVLVSGKDNEGLNIYEKVDDAVSDQTFTAGGTREDMTGIHGGTFNVKQGVLYFLNNSAGKKKYEPRSEQEMTGAESATGVSNYFQFFHRFGQTGEPTFSSVTVSSDAINIATYTVNDAGEASLFDSFKVIKEDKKEEDKDPIASVFSNVASHAGFSIYPNPANNQITVVGSESIESIRIVAMNGTVLLTHTGSNVVDITNLAQGKYVLQIATARATFAEQLVVKK